MIWAEESELKLLKNNDMTATRKYVFLVFNGIGRVYFLMFNYDWNVFILTISFFVFLMKGQ